MALSERDRRAVLMGGIGLGLVLLYLFVIDPLASGYAKLVAEHERLAARVARAVYSQKKNAYLAKQVAQYEENTGSLAAPKPYGEQVSAVGEQIVAAAQANGVQLKGTTPAAGIAWPDDATLEMAIVRIDGEAEWEKTFQFIAALYQVNGVLSVEQLEMTSDPKKGGKITLRLSISVLASKTANG